MKLGRFTSQSFSNSKEMYKKCLMHVQSFCFANLDLTLARSHGRPGFRIKVSIFCLHDLASGCLSENRCYNYRIEGAESRSVLVRDLFLTETDCKSNEVPHS